MPTNLPEKSKAIWARAIAEKDPSRKLALLKEFYSSFPKHKSTERLEMSIKRQMASLEEKIERAKSRRTGSSQLQWAVKKDEVQVAAVGDPLTLAEFSSRYLSTSHTAYEILSRPQVSVLSHGGVSIQVVLVPFDPSLSEPKQRLFASLARSADGVLVVPSSSVGVDAVVSWFEENNMHLTSRTGEVNLTLTPTGGLRITGGSGTVAEEAKRLLSTYRIKNAIVKLGPDSTLDDVEAAVFEKAFKVGVVLSDGKHSSRLKATGSYSKEGIVLSLLDSLSFIRVYTRDPAEGVSEKPVLLRKGSSVVDLARTIHKEMVSNFSYARVWRGERYSGEKVGRDFRLQDGDVIEVHSSLGR